MIQADGALLIDKSPGISSFGVIEQLQRQMLEKRGIKKRDLPKIGHGGTLDPFATGLLPVCIGRAVKLARYFLGGTKSYDGVIRFGVTSVPGDPTGEITETSPNLPASIEVIRDLAHKLTLQPYLQTPPMHSAKKVDGKPLYELARAGLEIEREPKLCHLFRFEILDYADGRARFSLSCSSGTYVRTLAQDLGRLLGSVALLETLRRTETAGLSNASAWTLDQIGQAIGEGRSWNELPCWVPFDRLLDGYQKAFATEDEARALVQGRQNVLFNILRRTPSDPLPGEDDHRESCLAIYNSDRLVAVARRTQGLWGLERVFTPGT